MNIPLIVHPPGPNVLPREEWPSVEHLVIEDGKPVDNIISEKLMRLLTEPLYSSWTRDDNGPFAVFANVGLFYATNLPPVVPDVMLSLDVWVPQDRSDKVNLTYLTWVYGKLPEVAIEIVSNKEGGEDTDKLKTYAKIGIPWYVIYDPTQRLSTQVLRIYSLTRRHYKASDSTWFPDVGLGLGLWTGVFEGTQGEWLRWQDRQGKVIPTGAERADMEKLRAEQERQRAEQLVKQLRALGHEPNA